VSAGEDEFSVELCCSVGLGDPGSNPFAHTGQLCRSKGGPPSRAWRRCHFMGTIPGVEVGLLLGGGARFQGSDKHSFIAGLLHEHGLLPYSVPFGGESRKKKSGPGRFVQQPEHSGGVRRHRGRGRRATVRWRAVPPRRQTRRSARTAADARRTQRPPGGRATSRENDERARERTGGGSIGRIGRLRLLSSGRRARTDQSK
jgi:hypothetical protein